MISHDDESWFTSDVDQMVRHPNDSMKHLSKTTNNLVVLANLCEANNICLDNSQQPLNKVLDSVPSIDESLDNSRIESRSLLIHSGVSSDNTMVPETELSEPQVSNVFNGSYSSSKYGM